ncbi:putative zinc finger protein [Eutypa lata UCREL1]|uniref:Putative zinc finger protein n=1 Tax=Eutypa lata (strain UCR-EL1) TaxID=1287681 RepID=M7SDJ1_EUTLA|nr:putative zinc finger protein [Eutypa lata UCREL1]
MSIPTGIPTSAPAGGVPVGIPARAATTVPHGSQVAKRVTGVSPIGPQWRGIEGLSNIVYSDVPDPSQMRVKASESAKYRKPTWPVFKHKYLNDNLVSGRSQRFPGQILCDHAAVKARMDGSGLDDNTKAQLEAELKKLNSEFLNVTGDHIKSKGPAKRKTKVSVDDSSDSSDDGEDIDRRAKEIKSAVASPNDLVKVVEQKVVNIVWQDPTTAPKKNATGEAIAAYGKLVDELWAKHKDLKDAITNQKNDQAKALRDALKRQTELIHVAVETINTFGADSIVENMGSNRKLTGILYNFVSYCWSIKDFNGPVPKSVLGLVSEFTTVPATVFDKLKEKLSKLASKFDSETRELLEEIIDNFKKYEKQRPQPPTDIQDAKKPSKTPTTTTSSVAKETSVLPKPQVVKKDPGPKSTAVDSKKMQPMKYAGLESARKISNGVSAKRPRDDDSDSRSTKKVAVEGTTGTPATNKQSSATPASSSASATTTTVQTRPKTSTSILPGKSRPMVKPTAKKVEPPPQRSVFGSLLEEIAKPKEKPKPREEPKGRPETEEEKARRLRKESRRGRRVTWAPEEQLVEYRYFQHDSAEDEGRAKNELQDAHDNRSEGQALKSAFKSQKEKEDGEESEDDDEVDVKETALRDWKKISVADPLLNEERAAKNFERRGGSQKTNTKQQKFISDYESPSNNMSQQPQSAPSRMTTQEERDEEVLALLNSKKVANWVDPDPYDPARPKTQRRYDYPDPKVQESVNALEVVVAEYKDKPFPPTEPPMHIQGDPDRVKEWWTGHNASAAARAQVANANKPLAASYPPQFPAVQQQLQPQPQPQQGQADIGSILQQINSIQANRVTQANAPTPQQPPAAAQPQMSTVTPDIQAVLQQLQAQPQPAPASAAPAPVAAPSTDANANAAMMAYYQMMQQASASGPNAEANAAWMLAYYQHQQQQGQSQGQQGSSSYGQDRDGSGSGGDQNRRNRDQDRRSGNNGSGRPHGGNGTRGGGNSGGGGDRDSRGINRSLIGTKPCTFWAKNQCTKGDKCTFRHDPADLVSSNY